MELKRQSRSLKTMAIPVAIAVGLCVGAGPAFADDAYRLDYKVSHSKYGDIGTYSNTINTDGQNTTVVTRSNIAVRVIGITFYRQRAESTEKWSGGRLISLQAATDINGKKSEVDGAAAGNHFQITTAKGIADEPAFVRVANPWSSRLMNGDTIITPEDGAVRKVQITPGQKTVLKLAKDDVPVRPYDIDLLGSKKRSQVWFDNSGSPVMFNMTDDSGTVTFTLNSKTPVSPVTSWVTFLVNCVRLAAAKL